jgi:hypothetical protein
MNVKEVKKTVDVILKAPQVITPYIHGKPGIGKSDIIRQIADTRGIGFIDLRLSQLESADVRGIPVPDLKIGSSRWLPPETIPFESFKDLNIPGDKKGRKFSDGGILFLDEFNRARFDVLQAGFQLVLDRRVGLHRLLDNWFVVCAGNLGDADKTEVTEITDSALNNRFIHFFIDDAGLFDCWIEWAEGEGNVHSDVTGFLRTKPSALYTEIIENDVVFCTPRSWDKFSRLLQQNPEMQPIALAKMVGTNLLGATITSFIDYLNTKSKIKPEDVLFNYNKFAKEIKKLSRDRKYSLSNEVAAFIRDRQKQNFVTKDVLGNFHRFATEDLDKDHMIALFKGLSELNIQFGGKEKEFLDPYLDTFPEMNDKIAEILYEARDNGRK